MLVTNISCLKSRNIGLTHDGGFDVEDKRLFYVKPSDIVIVNIDHQEILTI